MNKYIAVTIGDINGIGIKILFDVLKQKKTNNIILFTDLRVIKKYIKENDIKQNINVVNKDKYNIDFQNKKLNLYNYKSTSLEDNTYKSLKFAYEICSKNICIGIITLPLSKEVIRKKVNKNFIGHTEFFQNLEKKKNSNMILVHKKIIISTLTTHIEIKNISKLITNKKFIYNQILNLNNTLQKDFDIKKPKLIISGFNPHAGENGELGVEEIKFIKPTILKLKKMGIDIDGPSSADSILIRKNLKKYNCFIFIFHDQALIPFKFISQFKGVNYTGNLNIIRTSPDHGTAYDLINSKKFSNTSFLNCIKLIKYIHRNRANNDFS